MRPSAEPIGWADTQEDEGMYIDADFIIKAETIAEENARHNMKLKNRSGRAENRCV